MSATCSSKFVNSGCMCMPNPLDTSTFFCGYINRQNGLVYPCDLGCCLPMCSPVNTARLPRIGEEFRSSGGGILPPDFNVNLPQSDQPSEGLGYPYSKVTSNIPDTKVWQIFLKGLVFLSIILLAAIALKAW